MLWSFRYFAPTIVEQLSKSGYAARLRPGYGSQVLISDWHGGLRAKVYRNFLRCSDCNSSNVQAAGRPPGPAPQEGVRRRPAGRADRLRADGGHQDRPVHRHQPGAGAPDYPRVERPRAAGADPCGSTGKRDPGAAPRGPVGLLVSGRHYPPRGVKARLGRSAAWLKPGVPWPSGRPWRTGRRRRLRASRCASRACVRWCSRKRAGCPATASAGGRCRRGP